MALSLSGRALQDALCLPYITEQGTLALDLVCSKKRYDGYLRIWKRKLYEFAGLQRLSFSASASAAAAPAGTDDAAYPALGGAAAPQEEGPCATQARCDTWASRVSAGCGDAAKPAACR